MDHHHADDERSPLLHANGDRRLSRLRDVEARSETNSHVTVEEQKMGDTAVGERLPYNRKQADGQNPSLNQRHFPRGGRLKLN